MANSLQKEKPRGGNGLWDGPLALLALVAAVVAVYWSVLPAPFHLDDFERIVNDRSIHQLWPLGGTLSRPVLSLSLALNYAASGAESLPFRATNVVIHALASLFLLGILRRTLRSTQLDKRIGKAAGPLAFVMAFAWAVHPIHTQAVSYIWQRGESMMGMFFLGTVYCVVRHAENGRTWLWSAAAFLFFLLGLGTKEVMVTVLPVLFLFDGILLSSSFKEALRRRRSLYLAMVTVTAAGAAAMSTWVVTSTGEVSAWRYCLSQSGVVLEYLRLAVWPYPQSFDYAREPAYGFMATALPAMAIVALALATLWGLRRRAPHAVAGAWFLAVLAPTSSVVPINDLMVEYRMYLPLAPFIVLLVVGGWSLCRRQGWPPWVPALAVMVALSARTVARNQVFESNLTLWRSVAEASPENSRGHDHYGVWLALDGQLEEALEQGKIAIELDPSSLVAHWNYATSLVRLGKNEAGLKHYQIVLKENSTDGWRYAAKGELLLGMGRHYPAVQAYRRAVSLEPDVVKNHQGLAASLDKLGKRSKALRASRKALELDPGDASMWQLRSRLALELGKKNEAAQALERAVQTDPTNIELLMELVHVQLEKGDFADALVSMGKAMELDTSKIAKLSDLAVGVVGGSERPADRALAIQLGELAVKRSKRRDPVVLANLGRIYGRVGRAREGLELFNELLNLPWVGSDASALKAYTAERDTYIRDL